jgi:hypothetical protein
MFTATRLIGDITPRDLRWCECPTPEGVAPFLVTGAANCPYNVETAIVDTLMPDRAVRLFRLFWSDRWTGSPSGVLYARADGALIGDYYQTFIHDAEIGYTVQAIDLWVPPRARLVISYLNLTDSLADRPIGLYLSGRMD